MVVCSFNFRMLIQTKILNVLVYLCEKQQIISPQYLWTLSVEMNLRHLAFGFRLLIGLHGSILKLTSKRRLYHVRVVPAPGSGRGNDDVLMRSCPFKDGLDWAPWVVDISAVAPVVTRLTNGCVVGLQAEKCLFMAHNIWYMVPYDVIKGQTFILNWSSFKKYIVFTV